MPNDDSALKKQDVDDVDTTSAESAILLAVSSPEQAEAQMLAHELAATYQRLVEDFRARLKLNAVEAEAVVQERLLAEVQESQEGMGVRNLLPSQVDWAGLTALATHDPQAMVVCWTAINQIALDELNSGYRAAAAVAIEGELPLERARFLALRASLIFEWAPRGGVEMILLDIIVQAHTLHEYWLKKLMAASTVQREHTKSLYGAGGVEEPPRLSDTQAVEHAASMVDRFNRLLLRTLRQMRDLRRYNPPVNIMHAQQVNVGGQQMNYSGASEPTQEVDG